MSDDGPEGVWSATDWPGDAGEAVAVDAGDVVLHLERFATTAERGVVLVFLHGIGNYAGPYRFFARTLSDAGVAVYLPHLRGHGLSGSLGRIGTPHEVLDDLALVLERVRRDNAGARVVLGGESMGGLFALAYAASRRPAPDRLLLLVPALRPAWGGWLKTGVGRIFPSRAGGGGAPVSMHAPNPRETQRSPEYRERIQADPLALQRPSASYLLTIARTMLGSTLRYAHRVPVPTLIVQAGADRVLDVRAAASLARRLPDAVYHEVPDAWHNVLWDPTAPQTIDLVRSWLVGDARAE